MRERNGDPVRRRRALADVLVGAGLLLCAAAALHYARGWFAQTLGKEELAGRLAAGGGPRGAAELAGAPGGLRRDPILPASAARGYPVGEPLARLRVPAARIDAVVFGGSDATTLEKGPGHVPGTALPGLEGNAPHNCVITAHRDSHFRRLGWVRPGHRIELDTPGKRRSYRVVSRRVVDPTEVSVLRPTPRPRLTLITCYPFTFIGPAPKRLVVVAE
jgi:sortase A